LTPNYSSAYVKRPILIIDMRFSLFLAFGLLTTIMKSYSALGPSFRVILLVSSLEIGFSMYQDSCFISLFTILSFLFPSGPILSELSASNEYGSSGFPNFSEMFLLLN
jgi:hypothetical protein